MNIVIAFIAGCFIGFIGGIAFFRKNGARVEAGAAALSEVAKNVADTTKKL